MTSEIGLASGARNPRRERIRSKATPQWQESGTVGNWRFEVSSILGRNAVLTGKQLNELSWYRGA